ncbi:MerR family transcriptional regulator [Microvirga antarctica]|uniref:MerR family transcriptional regulator n=1 Tax=Microvirga antarctica TaxID=2819233 RepID=UPI001B30FCB9|nr:MerR family transcriptional regulator [Microvirga antarctica]
MDKSPDAFRTISEVAEDLNLPQHVLRFWETRFAHIRPLKRGGGRRYYRPDDVDLLKGIRHFLYGEGYTIKGVQRILKEEGVRFVQSVGRGEQATSALRKEAPDALASFTPDDDGLTAETLRALSDSELGAATAADFQALHAALDELLECDRVLSSLRGATEPDVNG